VDRTNPGRTWGFSMSDMVDREWDATGADPSRGSAPDKESET
jgi:hypothetical protein